MLCDCNFYFFFFQAEDGIRDYKVTGVQTCALPILAQALAMAGPGTDQVELRVVGHGGRPGTLGPLRVQVASFGEQANAQALARKLKETYSDVRIVTVELSSRRRYRVQVGQFVSAQQAEELAERLASQFDVDPVVIRDD